ncbi:helix-turn-helix transcriptional regulator [Kribbella sp. NBC_00889]|uniref:helix-turn-helix transcriptional regulator n=1 Tax=Kribbella sp. NBC_00889 TaxID=2975974 RepID=UPI003869CE99|nr:AraC family transcriptional regulator [Kribbella sp. NBC_00889]
MTAADSTRTGGVVRGFMLGEGSDAVVDALDAVFPSASPRVAGGQRSTGAVKIETTQCGPLGSDRWHVGLGFAVDTEPYKEPLVVWFSRPAVATVPSGELRVPAGGSLMRAPDDPMALEFPPFDSIGTRVSYRDLEEAAESAHGVSPDDFWLGTGLPLNARLSGYWQSVSHYVHRVLTDVPSSAESPLVAQQLHTHVIASMLVVFPNATLRVSYARSPGWVTPASVQRAVAYIDAHAAEPIGVNDIAEAVGTSARALQYAFRRHLECTPFEHLRQVRLERAHRDLQKTDPASGVTVSTVAYRWGFSVPRFTASYHAAYGRSPGRTLQEGS